MDLGDPCIEGSSCVSSTKISDSMVHNIDDLSEHLLVEILCRLPCNKFIFQCNCVSKHWGEVISTHNFICHFLSLQRDLQNPMFSTLVVGTGTFFPSIMEEDLTPNLRLPLILEADTLFVLGACNDLLLCCLTKYDQRELYICNPCTKQWVAIPPPPEVECKCPPIGFICEPYYNCTSKKDNLDDNVNDHHCKPPHKLSCTSTFTTSYTNTIIQLNDKYKWRVVRILWDGHVDMFFSETGYWRESVNVVCPKGYPGICSGGVAHNGNLYWHGSDKYTALDDFTAFTFELDPFGTTTTDGDIIADKCRITLGPVERMDFRLTTTLFRMSLGSSQGCLQVCPREFTDNFSVWELEEDVAGRGDDLKWRLVVNEVSLYQIDSYSKHPLLLNYGGQKFSKIVLGFHPNYKDIIYLDDCSQVLMCNLSARTLELVPGIPSFSLYLDQQLIHPFMLPWWLTPVPTSATNVFDRNETIDFFYKKFGAIPVYNSKNVCTYSIIAHVSCRSPKLKETFPSSGDSMNPTKLVFFKGLSLPFGISWQCIHPYKNKQIVVFHNWCVVELCPERVVI